MYCDPVSDAPKNEGVLAYYRGEPWACAKIRSVRQCAECRIDLPKGSEVWRPISNPVFRGDRVCITCMDKLEGKRAAYVLRDAAK